jgi:hypothetical protein
MFQFLSNTISAAFLVKKINESDYILDMFSNIGSFKAYTFIVSGKYNIFTNTKS